LTRSLTLPMSMNHDKISRFCKKNMLMHCNSR